MDSIRRAGFFYVSCLCGLGSNMGSVAIFYRSLKDTRGLTSGLVFVVVPIIFAPV